MNSAPRLLLGGKGGEVVQGCFPIRVGRAGSGELARVEKDSSAILEMHGHLATGRRHGSSAEIRCQRVGCWQYSLVRNVCPSSGTDCGCSWWGPY